MSTTQTGFKWMILLMIYFFIFTIILTLSSMVFGGGFSSDLNQLPENVLGECQDRRYIYEPYNTEYVSITDEIRDPQQWYLQLSHLDCSKSVGVTSPEHCDIFASYGCTWSAPAQSTWNIIKGWFIDVETPQETCLGTMNLDVYNINRSTRLITSKYYVDPHENSPLKYFSSKHAYQTGSLCTHPSIINDYDLCTKFSCEWYSKELISELQIEEITIKNSMGLTKTFWNTIKEMFTLQYDFGFDSFFINYIITFILFYLPFIMLLASLIMIIQPRIPFITR